LSGGANRAATDRAVSDLALISVRLGTGTAASCHSCVRALQCSVVEAVSAAESSAVDDQLVRNDIARRYRTVAVGHFREILVRRET